MAGWGSEWAFRSWIKICLVFIVEPLTICLEPWEFGEESIDNILTIKVRKHSVRNKKISNPKIGSHELVTEDETGGFLLKERSERLCEFLNLSPCFFRSLSLGSRVLDECDTTKNVDIIIPVLADSVVVISHSGISWVQAWFHGDVSMDRLELIELAAILEFNTAAKPNKLQLR